MARKILRMPSGARKPDIITEHDRAFSRAIRMHRIHAGLTQKEIGDRLGLTAQGLQRLETGHARATIGRAVMLSELFNVSLPALIAGADEAHGRDRLLLQIMVAWRGLSRRSRKVMVDVAQALAEMEDHTHG